jgi:GT2 family glycosyltransferase
VISALVPTRGGGARLERYLPSIRDSLVASGDAWEVLVVSDGGDGLQYAPDWVRVLSLSPAQGYGPAVNLGAEAALGELLLVLNDDVRLEPAAVRTLRAALSAQDVFAVTPSVQSPLAKCGDEGGKVGVMRAGLLEIEEVPATEAHPTLYPVGCCYLCRRQVFLDLGGYADVYAPFFWEDVELGYRAWRQGFVTLHVPQAVCHHEGSATIGQRPMTDRLKTWFRNSALFHLRNLQDPLLRAASLGAWAAYALFDDRPEVSGGLAEAVARFSQAGRSPAGGLADAAILDRVRQS